MLDYNSLETLKNIDYVAIADKTVVMVERFEKLSAYLSILSVRHKMLIQKLMTDPFPDFTVKSLTPGIDKLLSRGMQLKNRDLLFETAPGAFAGSHNNFPGGLILHTLTNIELAVSSMEVFEKIYPETVINRENVITALFLHDMMKSWIMTWKEDLSSYPDIDVEGHKFHHILIIALAIKEGLDSDLVKTLAAVHYHPLKEKNKITGSVKLAVKLLGISELKCDEELSAEQWIGYSAEHQSRELFLYCSKIINQEIRRAAVKIYGEGISSKDVNAVKNVVLALKSDLELYDYLNKHGRESFDNLVYGLIEKIFSF